MLAGVCLSPGAMLRKRCRVRATASGAHCRPRSRGSTYQKCTVLGPMGLFQNFAKPACSGAAAVWLLRRSNGWRNMGRKALKMREPGRNDMAAVFDLELRVRGREQANWAESRSVDGESES